MLYEIATGGVLLDHVNKTELSQDTSYASLTAPKVVRCVVTIDDEVIETVFAGAGGSHSWWTGAGGKLLPAQGLRPRERLVITVDGPAALRVEWT